jgi:hypothetical protein
MSYSLRDSNMADDQRHMTWNELVSDSSRSQYRRPSSVHDVSSSESEPEETPKNLRHKRRRSLHPLSDDVSDSPALSESLTECLEKAIAEDLHSAWHLCMCMHGHSMSGKRAHRYTHTRDVHNPETFVWTMCGISRSCVGHGSTRYTSIAHANTQIELLPERCIGQHELFDHAACDARERNTIICTPDTNKRQ